MTWVLDTNTVVFCLRGKRPSVLQTLMSKRAESVFIPMQVRAELLVGAAKSARPDESRAAVRKFIAPFELIEADTMVTEEYVRIRIALENAGKQISEADLWIAATALNCGSTLVTNNTTEFSRISGLNLEDWSQ